MSFLNFSTLAFQLGALIFLSIKLGNWLDYKCEIKHFFVVLLIILSIFSTIYLIIKQSKKYLIDKFSQFLVSKTFNFLRNSIFFS